MWPGLKDQYHAPVQVRLSDHNLMLVSLAAASSTIVDFKVHTDNDTDEVRGERLDIRSRRRYFGGGGLHAT